MAKPVTAVAEPRPLVDAPTRMAEQRLQLSISTITGAVIVRVSGAVNRHAAGRLYDTLVDCIGDGRLNLIVDLSDVQVMTRAGVRGLIVAAKLLQHGGGEMRICGAQRSIEVFLRSLGFNHLLKCDRTLKLSMAMLAAGTKQKSAARAAVMPKPEGGAPARVPKTRNIEQFPPRRQKTAATAGRRRTAG